jgi:hypothetical protein
VRLPEIGAGTRNWMFSNPPAAPPTHIACGAAY